MVKKIKEVQLTNPYDECRKTGKGIGNLQTYPNHSLVNIDIPMAALVIGLSGAGKTKVVFQLIKHMACFSKVYLYVKEPDEIIYNEIRERYKTIEKATGREMIVVSSNINDMIEPEQLDPNETNLIVIDDMLTEAVRKKKGEKSGQEKILDLYTKARKYNGSVLYVTQSYFDTDDLIRKSTNYVFIKKVNTEDDLKRILSKYKWGVPVDKLLQLYEKSRENPNSFFLIDNKTEDPNLKYRNGFTGLGKYLFS